jgi:DNA gyrase subunit A
VRRFAAHLVGTALRPGTELANPREGGPPAALCWSKGSGDLLIATRSGKAIRFSERQVPVRGCLGMRLDRDDVVCGVAAVDEESGVFLVEPEGKGTVRQMSGFSANKSPGSGGKTAMKTDVLIGTLGVEPSQDLFMISRLGKIIRFAAEDVPPKTGVVQGVNCMSLRADEVTAITVAG